MDNNMKLEFDAKSQNESLARIAVAAFLTEIDPTIEELNEKAGTKDFEETFVSIVKESAV